MSKPGFNNLPDPNTLPAWATEQVLIVPSDPSWPVKAAKYKETLQNLLAPFGIHTIEHIGSTAVTGLASKPIIDLAAEIPDFAPIDEIARLLQSDDWHYVPLELDQRPERRFFIHVKNNKRAAHLQFLLPGSPRWTQQLRFRNHLIHNPSVRDQYARLKMELAEQHSNDREAYTAAKTDFITKTLRPRIVFATNNSHKVEEIQAAIGSALEIISLRQAGIDIDIPEPHDTLEANATEKSSTIHRLTGDNCFSEDTGLEVEALNGEPGVKSARYAGEDRAFEKNIEKLLTNLKTSTNRRARFRTVISLIWNGKEHFFEGICNGHILPAPTGEGGFGYDPVFVPEGETRSFAQMSLEEKNHYSHRRKAADQLVTFLKSQN